ncbi:MAG: hypothetical protein ACM3KH_00770, partial [Thiobacillus sp.]
MRKINKYLGLLFAAVILTSSLFVGGITFGADLSKSQQEAVIANCTSAKNTLNQLHASDALLRVNMGQMYEAISTKLMGTLNRRISNNGFNNSTLRSVSDTYTTQLDKFRADYITYEDHLSVAIHSDCKNNPSEFYNAVATARDGRDTVHDDVIQLNKLLDEY